MKGDKLHKNAFQVSFFKGTVEGLEEAMQERADRNLKDYSWAVYKTTNLKIQAFVVRGYLGQKLRLALNLGEVRMYTARPKNKPG